MKTITKEYAARIAAGTINMVKCGGGEMTDMDTVLRDENEYVVGSASDFGSESLFIFIVHQGEPSGDWPDYSVTFNPMDLTGYQEDMDFFTDYAWLYSCLFHAAEMSEHYSEAKLDEESEDRRGLERKIEMRNFDVEITVSWRNGELYSIALRQCAKIPLIHSIFENFVEMKKADLVDWAEALGYEKNIKLKKDEMEELIVEELLKEETLFYRIAFLNPSTTAFFDEDKGQGCKVSDEAWDEACLIKGLGYGTLISGKLYIYAEAKSAWKKIDKTKFRAYQKRASWVWKCLNWTNDMYKYTPADVFLQVINARQGMRMSKEELYDIFDHFPADENWTMRYDDVFIDYSVQKDEVLDKLLDQQNRKSFYIPSPAEVEELYAKFALISDPAYRNMYDFLTGTKGIKLKCDAEDMLVEFWDYYGKSSSPEKGIQWFMDRLELEDDTLFEKFLNAFMELANNTRSAFNRGHKAIELSDFLCHGEKPVIVAGSAKAAEMLKQGKDELNAMGIKVDLEANAETVPLIKMQEGGPVTVSEKKIYPNDPCPCGSGKKYKKCCGK